MKTLRLWIPLIIVAAMIAPSFSAQDASGKPAPEMAKLDFVLGNWTGSGKAFSSPDNEGEPWTMVSTAKKILDGHFIQVDSKIEVGAPMPLLMREIFGWDAKRKCYTVFTCGNTGNATKVDMRLTDDNTLVYSTTRSYKGKRQHTQWTITCKGDTQHAMGRASVDGGKFFPHIDGSTKRGGDGFSLTSENANVALASVGDQLDALKPLAGHWSYDGWVMDPKSGKTEVAGSEVITMLFGGHVMMSNIVDDKTPYRGMSYVYWSPAHNGLRMFSVSMHGAHDAAIMVDDKGTTSPWSVVWQGAAMAGISKRAFTSEDEHTVTNKALMGEEPVEMMMMTMKRAKS